MVVAVAVVFLLFGCVLIVLGVQGRHERYPEEWFRMGRRPSGRPDGLALILEGLALVAVAVLAILVNR